MDPWPHSEAGRFHRGISLAVALVAAPILAAVALRNHDPLELAVVGTAFLVVALTAWHLHAAFRAAPANFPVPQTALPPRIPAESLRMGYRKDEEAKR